MPINKANRNEWVCAEKCAKYREEGGWEERSVESRAEQTKMRRLEKRGQAVEEEDAVDFATWLPFNGEFILIYTLYAYKVDRGHM